MWWVMASGPLTRRNSFQRNKLLFHSFFLFLHPSIAPAKTGSPNLFLSSLKLSELSLIEGEKGSELTGVKTYNPLSRRMAQPTKRAVNQLTSLLHSIKQKDKSFQRPLLSQCVFSWPGSFKYLVFFVVLVLHCF